MEPKEGRWKELIIMLSIGFVMVVYLSLHIAHAMYVPPSNTQSQTQMTSFSGSTVSLDVNNSSTTEVDLLTAIITGLTTATTDPLDFMPVTWQVIIPIGIFIIIAAVVVGYKATYQQVYGETARGIEHGSAKWYRNLKEFNKRFSDPYDPKTDLTDPNVIISQNIRLSYNVKLIDDKRNLNMLIVGGSGAGKTFRYIKPNLAQMNSSAIVTDPSGEILACEGKMLINNGIKVKVFSTSDMAHSNCYNPFDYVYDEHGEVDEAKVSTMVFLFLKNADGAQKKSGGDPFWEKSAKAFLSALAYYLLENKNLKKECINFTTMLKLTQAGKVSEDSQTSMSQLDRMMEEHREQMAREGRESKALSNYDTFKLAPGKTANSILITCAVDLQLFNNELVKNMTRHDYDDEDNNVHLDKLGDEQTVLFINIPQANGTFNFLVSMMYSQMFDALYTKAEKICPEKWMIVDEKKKPVITMLKDEKTANDVLEKLKIATVVEKINSKGRPQYRVMAGKTCLAERPTRETAQRIIDNVSKYSAKRGGLKLPWHVRCLMDEFANIGEIPEFAEKLSTMRKYEISCCIVVQSLKQIEAKYKDIHESIVGNCDTIIYLGTNEFSTCEYISKLLGETTIRTKNRSLSNKSSSNSFSATKRPLMTPDEVRRLGRKKCIVIISGLDPIVDKKYNFLKHPNFKYTGDADSKNKVDQAFMDIYFNSAPAKKKIASKVKRQKAVNVAAGTSVYTQPDTKEAAVKVFGDSETETEAIQKTTPVVPPEETAKAIEKAVEQAISGKIEEADTSQVMTEVTDSDKAFFF